MSEVVFKIEDPQLISTNDAYYHPVRKTKSGRYMSYVCKSESLKKLQEFYQEELPKVILDSDIEGFADEVSKEKGIGLSLTLGVGMPRSEIFEHDSSNFIKALEDCIVKQIKVDDSLNIRVSCEKFVYDEDPSREKWCLLVRIGTYDVKNYEGIQKYFQISGLT